MKRTRYFSKDQLKQLKVDLINKALILTDGLFQPTTYLPSFDPLTDLINITVPQAAITSAWLGKLFDESNYEDGKKWSLERIDWCCRFLYQKSATEYFSENTPDNFKNLPGRYKLFLQDKHALPEDFLRHDLSYHLTITQTGCKIEPFDIKNDAFSGRLSTVLNGNAYFEFDNNKGSEKVYMIVHIGVAEYESLQYLSGLYLSVNSGAIPTSGPLLLVRDNILNDKIKYELFDKILTNKALQTITGISIEYLNNLIKKTEQNVQPAKDRLSAFYGIYQLYYRDTLSNRFLKAKLQIADESHVSLVSDRTYYTSGQIQIVSQDRLVINIYAEDRFATLITHFGKFSGEFLEKMKYFLFVYVASGNKTPTNGIALFKRVSDENEIIIGSFDSEDIGEGLPEDLKNILTGSDLVELPDVLSYTQH